MVAGSGGDMRSFLYFLASGMVIGVAFWAYQQNHQTRQAQKRVDSLQREIAITRDALSIERAEWAYLNRPDRLRDLVNLNFDALELLPMTPDHFATIDEVIRPPVLGRLPIDPRAGLSASTSSSADGGTAEDQP